MKRIILLTLALLPFIGCKISVDEKKREEQTLLSGADFPLIITKVIDYTQNSCMNGKFQIEGKKMDGNTKTFTTNIKYTVGDTLTLTIDTTHQWEKVKNLTADTIAKDTIKN